MNTAARDIYDDTMGDLFDFNVRMMNEFGIDLADATQLYADEAQRRTDAYNAIVTSAINIEETN